ncbi:RHS repeat-associated core domain-containing protein, partial [Lysobacter sp. Root667]|uniref:RHS repeat-associated core domain-containing protein n=1 Tax=Lysobacter sp. Root667 TaxID=1736581 RepID=UPI000A777997
YDTNNRLTNVQNSGGASVVGLSYDVQGNLNNKNGQQYGFDYGNRLRWVMGKENYRYDGHGRRSKIQKDNGLQEWFQYSQAGQYLFSSKLTAGGVQTTQENVYLSGSVIATIDHNWPSNTIIATKYQHTDALGSPVATTDTAGALIERTNYEPYGSAINKTVDGIGYTGHVMDGATGLTYMQQRYYDPSIGRFLSVDPVGASGTGINFNRYKYAANNPYRFIDPDGREEKNKDNQTKACGTDTTCRISSGQSAGAINGVAASARGSIFAGNGKVLAEGTSQNGAPGVSSVAFNGGVRDRKPISVPVNLPGQDKWALSQLLGVPVEAISNVQVLSNSPKSKLYGAVATTGVNVIFVAGSGESFMSDPRTMLEEYFHVIKQWNPGALTGLGYIFENVRQGGYDKNRFELQAKGFARDNLKQFEYLRTP